MKQYRSILSGAFALLVFVSSSSFMVGIHLCGGSVQNIALFTKAEGCAMEKRIPPCHRQDADPCCKDELISHDTQDFKNNVTEITLTAAPAVDDVLPPVLISEIIPSSIVSQTQFYNYDPPLRSSDITVSFQVFLI